MSKLAAPFRFISRHRTAVGVALLIWGGVSLHNQGTALHRTQRALEATQSLLLTSQKASTETRITTVTQRCEFTKLVVDELVRRAPQIDAAPFARSYEGCERQLAKVKQINATTPAAR